MNRILDKKRLFPWQLCGLVLVIFVGALWLFRGAPVSSKDIRHVLLISIDTCRADYLSCYGFGRKTTPNIDAIANEGFVFENVLSPVPMTLPAHSSMLTGTTPPYHGVHGNLDYRLGDSNVSLAEILKGNGFTTAAFVSAFVMDSQFGLAQGFDSYNDRFDQQVHRLELSERRGEETSRLAIEWLEQHKNDRFFLFVHYFDPHTDYVPPEPFASRFADNLYAGEIAYADYCIAQVIQKLKDLRLFDSTLIIITSDHGEMLGEHREEEHSYFIYQSAIKVPLIFKLPGQGKSRGIKELVGLIDIVPTVCSLLGIQPPPQVQGIDLTGYFFKQSCPDKERYIYCESLEPTKYGCNALLGVVTDRWKYIQTTRPELYDLIKDPQESDNMVMKEPRRGHMLKERLKLILQEQLRKDSDSKVVLDEQTRKRLESLGYVSGSVAEDFEFDQSKDDPKDLIDLHLSITEVDHLISERRFAEAKKLCEKLRSQNPDFYLIYRYSAKVDFKEGDKEKAKAYMLESLKRNPNQADLHRYLSIVLAEQGKHNDAIYHLAESLRLNPYQISAHNNVAILLEEQGEREKAIVHLTESLRLKHNQPDIHIKLGNIFYQMARFDKAIKHWAESLQLNPQKPHIVHNKLGNAFHRLGMLDDAIEHWSESLKLKPEQPTIINNIAEVLAQKSKKRLDYTGDKYQN